MSDALTSPARAAGELAMSMEAALKALPADQLYDVDSLTRHYFADGVYVREMTIPANACAVGKIHKTEHVCIVSKGELIVLMETGERRRIVAPATFVSPPGVKRAVYAVTESVWTVVHPTHERDLERIEAQFIAKDFDELERIGALGEGWVLDKGESACPGVL